MPPLAPPSSTLLAALPALALDLETTGLDVRADRVVQAACLPLLGSRLLKEPRLEALVDPGIAIPAAATRIHGIDTRRVSGAATFSALAPRLAEIFEGRALIGHRIAFDLSVLSHEAARYGLPWRTPPALDVALLVGALEPSIGDLSLEAIAEHLRVPVQGRHSAAGDARAAAEIYLRLLPRLREAGVRTLGEAQTFSARRADLLEREARAGWHARPAELLQGREAASPIDSYIFERRASDAMSAPPEWIVGEATLRQAARAMSSRGVGALLVGAPALVPEGMLTERDLLRANAAGIDLDARKVRDIMSSPVATIGAEEPLYRALGRMDRGGFRHLAVVDQAGATRGVLSQRDLLRHRARAALALGDEICAAQDALGLAAAYGKLPMVAERLSAEGVQGREVARVVSMEVRALTSRAAELSAARLASSLGASPAPWCMMVLGSAGRGESLLAGDQDNAIVHGGKESDDAWFAALGTETADLLDEAGLPRCKGGVMAANATWRGTREAWRNRVAEWLAHGRPEDLLNVDIFFDLFPVAGETALARELHAFAVHAAASAPRFIALLAHATGEAGSAVGFFGGLRTEAGRVDLKRGGLLPLVGFARTLALRVGADARATADRLHAAVDAGRLAEADARLLVELQGELLELIVAQQLADLSAGVPPSSRVSVRRLERSSARRLAGKLRRLDEMLVDLRQAVAG